MKIVYYLPSLYAPGGLERIITFKANYFAEHFDDYEIIIITSEQVGKAAYFALSPKVKHIDLNTPFDWPFNQSRICKLLKYPFRYYKFKRQFSQLLKKLRPDITISTLRRELNFINSIDDGSIKIGEFHVTRSSYGVGSATNKNPIGRFLKKKWEKDFVSNLTKLQKLVILTHEEAAYWPELSNIAVIPNPIITPMDKQSDCSSKRVIAAGRYAPQKGFDLLIESWSIISHYHPSWKLHIYGEGALRNSLQEQINRLELTDTCILEHTVPNITDKYCESSIFVLSSRFEGFGMVITEAMGCGVPPVSFSCPCGPKDIITDEVNGLLADNGDIKELAKKISYLIENEEERKRMGKQAHTDAEKYKMEKIAQLWKNVFDSLLKK